MKKLCIVAGAFAAAALAAPPIVIQNATILTVTKGTMNGSILIRDGKIALVATGHAIALAPGVLASTLRADVTTLALVNPPTRGIYAVLPRHDPHPSAPLLLDQLMTSFG